MDLPTVRATDAATRAVADLTRTFGPLVIVQSAGCCDGSAPMCVPASDFPLGADDIQVGVVAGVPVHIARRELRAWTHHDLLLDVQPGYADGLSLAPADGMHFVSLTERCHPPQTGNDPRHTTQPTTEETPS
jgi:uncharacterized protein (DUF779 family)